MAQALASRSFDFQAFRHFDCQAENSGARDRDREIGGYDQPIISQRNKLPRLRPQFRGD